MCVWTNRLTKAVPLFTTPVCNNANGEMARMILAANPTNINACFKTTKETALHRASAKGMTEICQELIRRGAKVKVYNNWKMKPHYTHTGERAQQLGEDTA